MGKNDFSSCLFFFYQASPTIPWFSYYVAHFILVRNFPSNIILIALVGIIAHRHVTTRFEKIFVHSIAIHTVLSSL